MSDFFENVWQLKDLRAHFSDVWQTKDLARDQKRVATREGELTPEFSMAGAVGGCAFWRKSADVWQAKELADFRGRTWKSVAYVVQNVKTNLCAGAKTPILELRREGIATG